MKIPPMKIPMNTRCVVALLAFALPGVSMGAKLVADDTQRKIQKFKVEGKINFTKLKKGLDNNPLDKLGDVKFKTKKDKPGTKKPGASFELSEPVGGQVQYRLNSMALVSNRTDFDLSELGLLDELGRGFGDNATGKLHLRKRKGAKKDVKNAKLKFTDDERTKGLIPKEKADGTPKFKPKKILEIAAKFDGRTKFKDVKKGPGSNSNDPAKEIKKKAKGDLAFTTNSPVRLTAPFTLVSTGAQGVAGAINFNFSPVPEPATLMLSAVGAIVVVGGAAWRRRERLQPGRP